MTPELKQYYDDARDLFLTPGWQNFMAEVANNINGLRIENVEDEKAFWIAKGQLSVLHQIAGYENFLQHSEEQEEEDE